MTSDPKTLDLPYIGYARETGVVQRLVNFDQDPEEGELRIEALVPPDGLVLVVTRQRAHSSEIDQHLAAASAGISVSSFVKDHAAARRDVDHATEADWLTSTIVIDEERHPVNVLQLLSGNWAGYAQYRGLEIALGTRNIDVRDVRLATVSPVDLVKDDE